MNLKALRDIFFIYLRLGCISFGGPTAHLGYYKEAFVTKRQWLSEARFAELLNLCQFVPGPSSSQLGFAIGWHRGGIATACAAWLGFTLPSALLMIAFAYGLFSFGAQADPVIRGLLIAAVAVVAKAVLELGRKLCPDLPRLMIAVTGAALILLTANLYLQIVVILLGGVLGNLFFRKQIAQSTTKSETTQPTSKVAAITALSVFTTLLILSLFAGAQSPGGMFALHYKAGALVFGGGHVVLPLLNDGIVTGGLVSRSDFLAGYSAAQALPGPLFTFSAFLGTTGSPVSPAWLGGVGALIAIFLPGMLLLLGILPFWDRVRNRLWARAGLLGANAAVVGLLLAAFVNPVFTHGIHTWLDGLIAILAFVALYFFKRPPWMVVLSCGVIGGLIFS